MLDLDFIIKNPWSKPSTTAQAFKGLAWDKKIGKYKQLELQLGKLGSTPLDVHLNTDWRGYDHAGPHVSLSVFGLMLSVGVYDTRHWDDTKNAWDTPAGPVPAVVITSPSPTAQTAPAAATPVPANDNVSVATAPAAADHKAPEAPSSQ